MRSFAAAFFLVAWLLSGGVLTRASAQERTESNVIYGMYSGLALLMDVHHPPEPNGYGVVVIDGSGWHEPLTPDVEPLKDRFAQTVAGGTALLERGYTVFAINHRAAPAFRYPDPVIDAQRAVRFIRHHAARYGIDPERIGAIGHSSGAHLVSMLGVLDGEGDAGSPAPVNRASAKVQAVVAVAAPTDLAAFAVGERGERAAVTSFVGTYLARWRSPELQSVEYALYAEASPISYVTPDDPPFLLVHGTSDSVVPFTQSEILEAELSEAGVTVELLAVPNGDHVLRTPDGADASAYFSAMADWFDGHLKRQP